MYFSLGWACAISSWKNFKSFNACPWFKRQANFCDTQKSVYLSCNAALEGKLRWLLKTKPNAFSNLLLLFTHVAITTVLIGKPFNKKDLISDLQLSLRSTLGTTDSKNASLVVILLKMKINDIFVYNMVWWSLSSLTQEKLKYISTTRKETMSRVEMFQPSCLYLV